jgi:hypothetical protein
MAELIVALNDPDKDVRLSAQIVIRYLGQDEGLRALAEYYERNKNTFITGPIPIPILDRDYDVIRSRYLVENLVTEPLMDALLFALALDGSERAMLMFKEVITNARKRGFDLNESRYITVGKSRGIADEYLAESVLKNASFLNAKELQHATARIIAYNESRNKALIEICVNSGPLAQEWYHVVVSRHEKVWSFFSITQVAVA